MELLEVDRSMAGRYLNDGFSGGEKKRVEILQMAMLQPQLAILDETDSGLDIDALKVVANGVNHLAGPDLGVLVITHYQRLLDYVTARPRTRPDRRSDRPVRRPGARARARGRRLRRSFPEGARMTPPELAVDIGEYQYGFHDPELPVFKTRVGLDEDVVREISAHKGEPQWMLDFRLKALKTFLNEAAARRWGGDLSQIDFD